MTKERVAMAIPPELWSNPQPEALIETLERRQLENAAIAPFHLFGQIDGTEFVRVREISRYLSSDKNPDTGFDPHGRAEDLLSGFYGLSVSFAFLIVGKENEVALYLGLREATKYGTRGGTLLHTALSGLQAGASLDDSPGETHCLGQKLKVEGYFAHQGIMTGIPTLKQGDEDAFLESPWDRVSRGLYGEIWGCFVLAKPLAMQQIVNTAHLVSEARRLYSFHAKEQMQKGPGVTAEAEGGTAHSALELLKKMQEQLETAKAEGMWEVETHYFASNEATIGKVAALLRSAFAGQESRPEPLRTLLCSSNAGNSQFQPSTSLSSKELAVLIQLPQWEKPGYAVKEIARFDVAFDRAAEEPVVIGRILDGGRDTGNPYSIERTNLAKHTLVAGVTGSGKTNTCFQLLDQTWQRSKGVPFLVIEPAKTEYRDLLKAKDKQGKLIFPGLRIFTLGNEQIAPLRLNPFEFEILDAEHGIQVQTHIDHLKSVFNASFVLYAPMPYVLERCLHEVYRDRGWDLASSANRRVPKIQGALPSEVFPTLSDLYNKISEVVDLLGYEERIRLDVKAALETRINSLRISGKGLMLDTTQSMPLEELLKRPTVLELESLGDDDEKVFLISLLLARLYEHRIVQAKQCKTHGGRTPALQHLTVIEEAHRLLRHVPIESHPDVANVRGKAVETFSNMLAEVRAYGEGVIVAEQIPSKLALDVVKNTNLKILHRVVAEDDRFLVGSTMNLDKAQNRFVVTLNTGQSAVFAEGDDAPFFVYVDEHPATRSKGQVTDRDVEVLMHNACTSNIYYPYVACQRHCRLIAGSPQRCPHHVRDQARSISAHPSVQNTLSTWVLSTAEETEQFIGAYPLLRNAMRRLIIGHPRDGNDLLFCTLVQGLDFFFERKMRQYDWLLRTTQSLKAWLLAAATDLVLEYREEDNDQNQQILNGHRDVLERFGKAYQQQCKREIGPHVGCDPCMRKCLYRYEVQSVAGNCLLRDLLLRSLRGDYEHQQGLAQDSAMWQQVCQVCLDAAELAIVTHEKNTLKQVALCYSAQMGLALGFGPAGQKRLTDGVRRFFWTEASL
jgi:hypothetical protein